MSSSVCFFEHFVDSLPHLLDCLFRFNILRGYEGAESSFLVAFSCIRVNYTRINRLLIGEIFVIGSKLSFRVIFWNAFKDLGNCYGNVIVFTSDEFVFRFWEIGHWHFIVNVPLELSHPGALIVIAFA